MRMKKSAEKVTRYEIVGMGMVWNIDIIEKEDFYEAWISHPHYTISEMMVGFDKEEYTMDEFLEIAIGAFPGYAARYAEDRIREDFELEKNL